MLVLAGDIRDSDLARWKKECAAHGIELPQEKIVRSGYLGASDLDVLYRRAELLVLTTTTESSSMPVIEAMARACPVIASDIDVHREVAGDAAVLVDAKSPSTVARVIERLMDDEIWRDRLVQAGKLRAANFTWEECARKTAAVYEHALSQ